MHQRRHNTNPNIVTYKKSFDDFNKAFYELIKIPEVEEVLKLAKLQKTLDDGTIEEYYDDSSMLLSDATYAIALYITLANNTPYLLGKKNIHTKCNISANRCFIKTENEVGFGWNIRYHLNEVPDKNNSRRMNWQAFIDQVTCSVVIYNKNMAKDQIDILEQNGWSIETKSETTETEE